MKLNADNKVSLRDLPKDALVSSDRAAKYLTVSKQWLAVLRMRSEGPSYYKLGTVVKYKIADLDTWLELQRVEL